MKKPKRAVTVKMKVEFTPRDAARSQAVAKEIELATIHLRNALKVAMDFVEEGKS